MIKLMKGKERREMLSELEKRFGFDKELFKKLKFIQYKDRIDAVAFDFIPEMFASFKIETAGMSFARISRDVKPTTNMIQTFGRHATKNVLSLNKEEMEKFVRGLDLFDVDSSCTNGYVVVKYKEHCLGCGLLNEGNLKNQVPKQRRIQKLNL